ncbi:MAG: branched-chain amino acid aminotransferase [Candidatus Scalindua sp.]|jgi:branched-chain amino acid aminotransferase|nr:branched-chain amino acid aminotransferase [Candidatus Scalindua sp.]MBT6226422.1 branched-chain amino acid aminotransferase [Candidatus Scalindua sp.]
MKSGRQVYINGTFVPENEAKISIFDSALMFGDMVFEMTRSFNKKQFKLREHLERLYMGINILRIPLKMTIDELEQACFETIEKNEPVFETHDEHRLMINVSRGPLGIYAHVFDGKLEPTVVIADFPLKWTVAGMAPLFDKGINAVIPSQRAIPASLMDPKIKHRSRMFYQMANIEVSQIEGENIWALLVDPDGYITEGTGDNIFIVKNGELFTPEGRNILRGISRAYVFELAEQLGMPCQECNIEPYDVYEADEAFMTATPFCILPTVSLNGITIGNGKMGDVTRKLIDQWSYNVGVDIEQQIKDYGVEVNNLNSNTPTPYQFKR